MMLRNRFINTDNTDNIDNTDNTNNTNNTNNYNKYGAHSNISKEYIDNVYNIFFITIDYTYKGIKIIINVGGIYLLWIFLHYLASHLYVKLCVPNTIFGFVMSPFMTATPHCQGLRWVIYNSANMINNMWIVLGSWICSTILIVNKYNNDVNTEPPLVS
jgi:hypothetical protein